MLSIEPILDRVCKGIERLCERKLGVDLLIIAIKVPFPDVAERKNG